MDNENWKEWMQTRMLIKQSEFKFWRQVHKWIGYSKRKKNYIKTGRYN